MWTPPLVWPPAAKSNHLDADTFLVIFCLRTILSLILADTSVWNLRVHIFQFCFWRICWAVLCWRDRGRWCGFAGGGGRQGGGGDRRLGFRVVQGGGDHAGEVGPVVVLHRVRRRPRGSAGGTKLWYFSSFTWSLPSRFVRKDPFTICTTVTNTKGNHDHLLLLFQTPLPLRPKPLEAATRAAEAEQFAKGPGFEQLFTWFSWHQRGDLYNSC